MDIFTLAASKKYTDKKTMIKNAMPVTKPSDFDWSFDFPILTDGKGQFETDLDLSDYENETSVTYYVDPVNGDNNNDGLTMETAFERIGTGIARAIEDGATLILKSGVYPDTNYFGNRDVDKSINIKTHDGKPAVISPFWDGLNWQSQGNGVYSASTPANTVIDFRDNGILDEYGDSAQYEEVSSIQEVEENPGTYYQNDTSVYVQTLDSREPGTDELRVFRLRIPCYFTMYNDASIYMENIHFEGGRGFRVDTSSAENSTNLYFKNCKYKYTIDHDGGSAIRGCNAYFQTCENANNQNDGFSYHAEDGRSGEALELDCVGRHNGWGDGNSDNGSTTHGGYKILRINSIYFENHGPNINDVIDSMAWNLSCVSNSSTTDSESNNIDFGCRTNAKVWLDNCVAFGSKHSLRWRQESEVYTRHCKFQTEFKDPEEGSVREEY